MLKARGRTDAGAVSNIPSRGRGRDKEDKTDADWAEDHVHVEPSLDGESWSCLLLVDTAVEMRLSVMRGWTDVMQMWFPSMDSGTRTRVPLGTTAEVCQNLWKLTCEREV